jgi:outer membrane receptor protein involved in Fe transport
VVDRDQKRLPGVYHQSAKIENVLRLHPFRLRLTGHYDDELYYDSANRLPADARKTLSAALSWEQHWSDGGNTEIKLEAGNLTDELYQDFNRFPSMGRNYSVNLQHTF